jgi:hypothetical protein
VVHEKVRQAGRLRVQPGDPRIALQLVHAQLRQLRQRHVELIGQRALASRLQSQRVGASQSATFLAARKRLEVASHAFDDPEVGRAADVGRHAAALAE